jgi:hypothetical protein
MKAFLTIMNHHYNSLAKINPKKIANSWSRNHLIYIPFNQNFSPMAPGAA